MSVYKVFAKAPGFPHFPGFITHEVPDYVFTPESPREKYFCVFFFNSWDYYLFPKLDIHVEEHIKLSKTTINWHENVSKYYKLNKNKKKYMEALTEGMNWSDQKILEKLREVVNEKIKSMEKAEAIKAAKFEKTKAIKVAQDKIIEEAELKPKRKRTPTIEKEKPIKKMKTHCPIDPLNSLTEIKDKLEHCVFTYPNNQNIDTLAVINQLDLLRMEKINFDSLKRSRVGKLVKRLSKLQEIDQDPTKGIYPPESQIEKLVNSGAIEKSKNLVNYWTSILSNSYSCS